MPYYEIYSGSHRLKLPLREHDSSTQNDPHRRHITSQHEALQTALEEDHHQFPTHHDARPRKRCPCCSGDPLLEEQPPLIVEIDGWCLESSPNSGWNIYKFADDGQPNPWTGFPTKRIDEVFAHTREEGRREALIVLQSAIHFLTADPKERQKHYQMLERRVDYPEDILERVRTHYPPG